MWRSKTYLEITDLIAKKIAMQYKEARTYSSGQVCFYLNTLKYCTASTTTGTYNPAHWADLMPYNPSTNYTLGQTVLLPSPESQTWKGSSVAQCTTETTGVFNPQHWKIILLNIQPCLWADVWNSQTDYIGNSGDNEEIPFPMPAIFIEFHNTTWTNMGGSSGIQQGKTTLNIHIVQEIYAESYDSSASQNMALSTLDFIDAVHAALQGHTGTHFSPLNRTEETLDTNHPNYSHHILTYAATIEDPAAATEPTLHQPENLHINPKYFTGTGGNYKMLPKIQETLNQNQPPPEEP